MSQFNKRFRDDSEETILRFAREGRGVSYHEFDIALNKTETTPETYEVVSDLISYMMKHNPAVFIKRLLAGVGRKEKTLQAYAPKYHRAFFHEDLNFIIQKKK